MKMNGSLKPNLSTVKAFQIIEVMAEANTPMRIKDISDRIKMPQATVLRFLHTLINTGYIVQEPEGSRYYLTLKLSSIADQINMRFDIREVIHPYLIELMERCEESTCLAIEIDQKATYIDAVEGPNRVLRTLQRIGKSAPLHTTGVGKNLLLNYSSDEIDRLVNANYLIRLTENTITSKKRLVTELEKVKEQGYAIDDEECELGVRCVAAPIWDYHNRVAASISVSGPVLRLKDKRLEEIKSEVLEVSKKISTILMGNKPAPVE